jgi:hypothetical protein
LYVRERADVFHKGRLYNALVRRQGQSNFTGAYAVSRDLSPFKLQ